MPEVYYMIKPNQTIGTKTIALNEENHSLKNAFYREVKNQK